MSGPAGEGVRATAKGDAEAAPDVGSLQAHSSEQHVVEVKDSQAQEKVASGGSGQAANGGGSAGSSSPDADGGDTPPEPSIVQIGYRDILKEFSLLGWTAFGGPSAHIGLFQRVGRRAAGSPRRVPPAWAAMPACARHWVLAPCALRPSTASQAGWLQAGARHGCSLTASPNPPPRAPSPVRSAW
jgi:hypothetical protein